MERPAQGRLGADRRHRRGGRALHPTTSRQMAARRRRATATAGAGRRATDAHARGLGRRGRPDRGRGAGRVPRPGVDQHHRHRPARALAAARPADGGTRVTLRLSYGAPGGIVGALTEQIAAGQVRQNLRRGLARLKADIDGVNAEVEGETAVSDQTKGLLGKAAYELGSVKILTEAGRRPPDPARQARPARPTPCAAGAAAPPPASSPAPSATPTSPPLIDELGTLTFDEIDERTNALAARAGRRRHQGGRRRGDHVPQPPRLRGGHGGDRQARRQLACT